ncbi:permease [Bradyrhizobium oligotrophicum S58]|uniref:Permease n=2 Tax=Bradyrhizobium oligotrophicum TaxID=44255 RepID=M4Z4R3_9BRAD|nr:permease [Bradyrhizobium oligotrophicum S58]
MIAPVDHDSTPSLPLPIAAADRLISLDILRGLALFGVMAVNVVFEFRVSIFRQFLPALRMHEAGTTFFAGSLSPDIVALLWVVMGDSPFNRAVEDVLERGVSMKAFALFSLLFGIGMAMQFDRIAPQRRFTLLLRRLLVLLAIGLLHLTLLWNGDILTEYALAGLIVLPFLYAPRWLVTASSLALLGLYFSGWLVRLMPLPSSAWMMQHATDAGRVYALGSFSQVLAFRLSEISTIAPLHLWVFPRTIGLFLAGIVIWRCGVLRDVRHHREPLLLTALAGLAVTIDAGPSVVTVSLALAYGALILVAASTAWGLRLLGWAAPLGRMAFTNYLMQSVIFSFVFYGYGFGLFGRVSVSLALGLGIIAYVLQAITSRWWLAYFRFGPVEWLWRSLMYGKRQPMRIA